MNNPRLIKCEQCSTEDNLVYLGSLSSQGNLILRSKHAGHKNTSFTQIISESFTLQHECGFTIKVESGMIITEQASPILNG